MNLCDFQVDVPIKYLNFFPEDDDELCANKNGIIVNYARY
jgi:hypothetical protein